MLLTWGSHPSLVLLNSSVQSSPSTLSVLSAPSQLQNGTSPSSHSIWDDPELSPKIRDACAIARANGFQYIWIDTCCIDKSSSSELSEAINSMYSWYAGAVVCYAYLADVPPASEEDPGVSFSLFRRSRWFTRGWTLQELIAPPYVEFVSRDWTVIGSKHTLLAIVEERTDIDEKALLHVTPLDKFSISQRFSWASGRETTRVEDEAYSLLGIFDINMPTLYGESYRAFRRLQEEIMRRIPDHSLFAWGDVFLPSSKTRPECNTIASKVDPPAPLLYVHPNMPYYPLADAPSMFNTHGGGIRLASPDALSIIRGHTQAPTCRQIEYTPTPYGIRTQFQMIPLSHYFSPEFFDAIDYYQDEMTSWQWYLAILECEHKDYPGRLLGKICYTLLSDSGVEILHNGFMATWSRGRKNADYNDPHLLPLSPHIVERCRPHIEWKTVYMLHLDRLDPMRFLDTRLLAHKAIRLILLRETREALLTRRAYTATLRSPDQDHPTTHWLELCGPGHTITVEFQHTLQDGGREFTITAYVHLDPDEDVDRANTFTKVAPSTGSMSWSNMNSPCLVWKDRLDRHAVVLNAGGDKRCIVDVGLDFAGMGFYLLRVDVRTDSDEGVEQPREEKRRGLSGAGCDAGTT